MKKTTNTTHCGTFSKLPKAKTEYKNFFTRTEADAWGTAIYSDWAEKYKRVTQIAQQINPKLPAIPQASLECYCGESGRNINAYLRGDDSMDEIHKEAADILSFVLASAPPIPEDIVVYRFVCDQFIQDLVQLSKLGFPIAETGFLSTSLVKEVAEKEVRNATNSNLLKIYVPKGTLGVYVGTVASPTECELLIAPNCFLRLVEPPCPRANGQEPVFECELYDFIE